MTADPQTIVKAYLDRLNRHATKEALALLAPDFTIRFGDGGYEMDREAAARALEWDAGTNGRLEWRFADEGRSSVTIVGTETNDFLELLGLGPLEFRSTFTVDTEAGLIVRQSHEVSWGDVSLAEALEPLIGWAARHRSEELSDIYPDGQMVYTRPMAERWVRLARTWRATDA